MGAVRFRLVLITYLLPRYRGEHELRIRHHRRGYRIILVRIPIPTSSNTLIAIFCWGKALVFLWVRSSFPKTGNITYQLTASTVQGDTIKAPFRTLMNTEHQPKLPQETGPTKRTRMSL